MTWQGAETAQNTKLNAPGATKAQQATYRGQVEKAQQAREFAMARDADVATWRSRAAAEATAPASVSAAAAKAMADAKMAMALAQSKLERAQLALERSSTPFKQKQLVAAQTAIEKATRELARLTTGQRP